MKNRFKVEFCSYLGWYIVEKGVGNPVESGFYSKEEADEACKNFNEIN